MSEGRSPSGWLRLACGIVAISMAFFMGGLAALMGLPVPWDRFGVIGAIGLSFPLQFLVFAALAAVLGLVARRVHAKRTVWILNGTALLATVSALVPGIGQWRDAARQGVPVSIRGYFSEASAIASQAKPNGGSVSYATASDGERLMLDLWLPGDSAAPRPVIVMVHGGAWTHGSRGGFVPWCRWFNELGYAVFDVEYRMPPNGDWKEEVGDVKAALAFVRESAGAYHLDGGRIHLFGQSAGGNLAALAAYTASDPELPPTSTSEIVPVRSVINIYGPCDLALAYDHGDSIAYGQDALRTYLGGSPSEFPERYRLLSPAFQVKAGAPPTLMLLGTLDRIVPLDQARVMDRALEKAGVPHETHLLSMADHGFDMNWGGISTQVARAKIRTFLGKYDAAPAGK